MTKLILVIIISFGSTYSLAQSTKIESYDLVKNLLYDSTGYENVGDWAIGQPKKYPVAWKADKIEMSPDTSINFYRLGTAHITILGESFVQAGQPVQWSIMLRGSRSGFTSSSISSSPSKNMHPRYTLDSVFGKRPFIGKLIRTCDEKDISGYYYYELKLPKKDIAYIKLGWISVGGSTAIRIDCYDAWSNYAAKLDCPK